MSEAVLADMAAKSEELRRLSERDWAAGRGDAAVGAGWLAYRLHPENAGAKVLLTALAGEFPASFTPEMIPDILRLLSDRDISPEYLSVAGWLLVMSEPGWSAAIDDLACEELAGRLDKHPLALALLRETPVHAREAERVLTRIRRWLLLSERWSRFPDLVGALVIQAQLNGGAWPFSAVEAEVFNQDSTQPLFQAYLPNRLQVPSRAEVFTDPLTRAVAADYECWPYPSWRRIMAVTAKQRLPDEVRALDPSGPDCLPVNAKILIAGCGTGSEAAQTVAKYPDAKITAIDLSEASLAYARERWDALRYRDIRFVRLDLHRVAELNERFDAIFSSGVLHHLPDPEFGWSKLAAVLRPGGVMRIMLYSRLAQAWIAEAQALVRDLSAGAVNDDVVRAVRQRFLDRPDDALTQKVINFSSFATLGGTHDLLMHRQDDRFDIPRIARALERLRLRLLTFVIADPAAHARYDAMFPQDRAHRSLQGWAMFERHDPSVFISQYDFWCRSEPFWFGAGGGRR